MPQFPCCEVILPKIAEASSKSRGKFFSIDFLDNIHPENPQIQIDMCDSDLGRNPWKSYGRFKQIKKNCDWRSGLTLWFNCGEVVVVFHYVVRFHFAMYSFSLVLSQQEAISSVQDKVSKQWPKPWLLAVYRGWNDEILPSYIWIIISHYKDPYQPTSIMECQQGLVHVAHLSSRVSLYPQLEGDSICDFFGMVKKWHFFMGLYKWPPIRS